MTSKEEKKLDKEAQVFKCVVCEEREVRWNGKQWECKNCKFTYNGTVLDELMR